MKVRLALSLLITCACSVAFAESGKDTAGPDNLVLDSGFNNASQRGLKDGDKVGPGAAKAELKIHSGQKLRSKFGRSVQRADGVWEFKGENIDSDILIPDVKQGNQTMTTTDPQPRLLIAGDSTVEDFAMTAKDTHQGWGAAIGKHLAPKTKVANLAYSGLSSKTFLAEGRWDKLLAQIRPGDFILVQFGHNDSHSKDRPEATDAATDYKDNLRRYADDAAKAKANLVFVTPPHRRYFQADGKITQELSPYCEAMKAVAREKGVPLVDLHALSGELMQKRGDQGCDELFRPGDRTHFSALGADVFAGLIVGELQRQGHALGAMRATP